MNIISSLNYVSVAERLLLLAQKAYGTHSTLTNRATWQVCVFVCDNVSTCVPLRIHLKKSSSSLVYFRQFLMRWHRVFVIVIFLCMSRTADIHEFILVSIRSFRCPIWVNLLFAVCAFTNRHWQWHQWAFYGHVRRTRTSQLAQSSKSKPTHVAAGTTKNSI